MNILLSRTIPRMSSPSYKEALKALNSLQTNAEAIAKWENERKQNLELDIKKEMDQYFNQVNLNYRDLSLIHVAGTKGKGSTCAFTESILRHCSLKTGLYTSPHLVSVRERIRINGQPISEDTFAKYFWQCWQSFDQSKPGYFRFLTILAFKIFASEKVDVAVIETGVGGRTDATNIRSGVVATGITSLGYDHMSVLGNTLTSIAYEKAGIFKKGVPGFTSPQVPEALNSLQSQAKIVLESEVPIVKGMVGINNVLGIEGEHNLINASLAVVLCNSWLETTKKKSISGIKNEGQEISVSWNELPSEVKEGLSKTEWPGRSQVVPIDNSRVTFHLDGAHTPESLEVCKKWFDNKSKQDLRVLVFNCATTRDPSTLFPSLLEGLEFDYVIFSTNENGKNKILEDKRNTVHVGWQEGMREKWKGKQRVEVAETIVDVIKKLTEFEKENTSAKVRVLVTGSFYLVGGFLEILKPEMCDSV